MWLFAVEELPTTFYGLIAILVPVMLALIALVRYFERNKLERQKQELERWRNEMELTARREKEHYGRQEVMLKATMATRTEAFNNVLQQHKDLVAVLKAELARLHVKDKEYRTEIRELTVSMTEKIISLETKIHHLESTQQNGE